MCLGGVLPVVAQHRHQAQENGEDQYSCLLKGYEKSIEQMEKIGRVVVNENELFIKFYCRPEKKIDA
jgi:hypothetical protein